MRRSLRYATTFSPRCPSGTSLARAIPCFAAKSHRGLSNRRGEFLNKHCSCSSPHVLARPQERPAALYSLRAHQARTGALDMAPHRSRRGLAVAARDRVRNRRVFVTARAAIECLPQMKIPVPDGAIVQLAGDIAHDGVASEISETAVERAVGFDKIVEL